MMKLCGHRIACSEHNVGIGNARGAGMGMKRSTVEAAGWDMTHNYQVRQPQQGRCCKLDGDYM